MGCWSAIQDHIFMDLSEEIPELTLVSQEILSEGLCCFRLSTGFRGYLAVVDTPTESKNF